MPASPIFRALLGVLLAAGAVHAAGAQPVRLPPAPLTLRRALAAANPAALSRIHVAPGIFLSRPLALAQ
jgi:hypothetical protein